MSHHHHRGGPAPFTREVIPDVEYQEGHKSYTIKRTKLPANPSEPSSYDLPYRHVEGVARHRHSRPASSSDAYASPRSSKIHTYEIENLEEMPLSPKIHIGETYEAERTRHTKDIPLSKKIHVGKTHREKTRPTRSPSPARYREHSPEGYDPPRHSTRKGEKTRAESPSRVRYQEHRPDAYAPPPPRHSTRNDPTPASKPSSSHLQLYTRKRHTRASKAPLEPEDEPHPYVLDDIGWPWWASNWATYFFWDKDKGKYFLSHIEAKPGNGPKPTTKDIWDLLNYNKVQWEYITDGRGLYFPTKCAPRLKCCRDGKHDVVG